MLSDHDREFIERNASAAMITLRTNGAAHVARVGVGFVDDKLWSSGTADRVRTKHLRRDPRCTLFIYDPQFAWLGLETTVMILDGPDAPDLHVRLFRTMQNKPTGPLSWLGGELDEPEFKQKMLEEQRLIYEFQVQRAYGLR